MQYTHYFFDLDGTITDSAPGITHAVQYALTKCGIQPPPANQLLGFIGPPLSWGFSHFFGMNEQESLRAVAYYREYYSAGGMLECKIYEGIPALLESLVQRGAVCVLATCKPHIYARAILEHFGLRQYFSYISGPELDGTRGEKDEVIAHAIRELRLTDPARILMIGDRGSDILGAKKNGIAGAGVLWGFGSENELREAGADLLCHAPMDLLSR